MRRFLAYVLCTAGMLGVYFLIHYAIYGVSDGFGYGFAVGVGVTILVLWGASRVQRGGASSRSIY